MPIDIEGAVARLYEDPSLFDEIDADSADALLKWAEEKLVKLAETHDDEEAFENEFAQLRKLVKSMNRFTARQQMMDGAEKSEKMGKLVERAQELGLPAKAKSTDTFNAQGVQPESANLYALIKMIDPSPPKTLPEAEPSLDITNDVPVDDDDDITNPLPRFIDDMGNLDLPDELA